MATNYDQFYKENPHGLGEPTEEFVTFFNQYYASSSKVLDVGCGQGRDAIFIARLGHHVTAVDLSPTGINDLNSEAKSEKLSVNGEVVDIRDYVCNDHFDVIVADRTLHMLAPMERDTVLHKLLDATKAGSHVLIADEPSNVPAFRLVFEHSRWDWVTTLARKGFLFMVRK